MPLSHSPSGDSFVLIKKIEKPSCLKSATANIMTLLPLVLQMSYFSSEPTLVLSSWHQSPLVTQVFCFVSCNTFPTVSLSSVQWITPQNIRTSHPYLPPDPSQAFCSPLNRHWTYTFFSASFIVTWLLLLLLHGNHSAKCYLPVISILTHPKRLFTRNNIVQLAS